MSIQRDTTENKATPPDGYDWGERSIQAWREQGRAPAKDWHKDAWGIRHRYGIPQLDEDAWKEDTKARMVYPNLIIHESEAVPRQKRRSTNEPGGETAMLRGGKGSGKSTLLLELEGRILAENSRVVEGEGEVAGEIVLRRGSPKRSEWLPYRYWATVWLPANASIEPQWMRKGENVDTPLEPIEDLESVVRRVEYYEDVFDLLDQLNDSPRGTYNVVYPDPSFRGCERATRRTDRGQFSGKLPFTPAWEAGEGEEATPLSHWWFGFLPALMNSGRFPGWVTLSFDELGDLSPEWASSDDHHTWEKMTLLRAILADSRREWLTFLGAIHRFTNANSEVLKEFERWIWMPDDKDNPTKNGSQSLYPPGIDSVPMETEWMANQPVGRGCCFNEGEYTPFKWGDISEDANAGRRLQIRLGQSDQLATHTTDLDLEDDQPELEYDEQIFNEWENQTDHRLYVKEPGAGYLDVDAAAIGEELESPVDGVVFTDDLPVEGGVRTVKMRETATDETMVVARLPVTTAAFKAGSGSPGVGR